MFAVKGWAVDATALKSQTEPHKPTRESTTVGDQQHGKKRKRGNGPSTEEQDVGKLWERHIEGKKPRKAKKQPKREGVGNELERTDGDASETGGKRTSPADGPKDLGESLTKAHPAERQRKKHNENGHMAGRHASKLEETDKHRQDVSRVQPSVRSTQVTPSLTPMQAAMRQKLTSARFRHLNQTLYTESSAKALALFDQSPDMFEDYHSGFRQQVSVWPENPVDHFIATIRARGSIRLQSQKRAFKDKKKHKVVPNPPKAHAGNTLGLPRTKGTCIIADLGCGDARLAQSLRESNDVQTLNLKILSYDLYSPSKYVTKADISDVPTPDDSIDVAIFCLALMGTNWTSFIEEAYRILHWKGELWIAEIKSRFGRVPRSGKPVEHSVGGKRKQAALKKVQDAKARNQEDVNIQETLAVEVDGVAGQNQNTDVTAFVDVLRRRGFVLKNGESSVDLSNKMFVKMEFVKAATPTKGKGMLQQDAQQGESKFKSKVKFIDEDLDDLASEDEAGILKPCLYKIR